MSVQVSEPDWGVLELPGVENCCSYAAHLISTHEDYGQHVEFQDMQQEARVFATKHAEFARECLSNEGPHTLGAFQTRVYRELRNLARVSASRGELNVSADERYDDSSEAFSPAFAPAPSKKYPATYDRPMVETLLPAVWDESFCYGMQAENAADVDMPRGSTNKATGNVLAAHLADIRIGWRKAPLTVDERRAIFLTFALDWLQKEIAYNQGVTQQTISHRLYTGVGKIVAELNGGNFEEFFTGPIV